MTSGVYDSFWDDLAHGLIIPSSDTFKALLVTNAYTFSKGGHTKRSDVDGHETAGTGYTAGGATTTCTLTKDTTAHTETFDFSDITFAAATVTARGEVIYQSLGGADTADRLVAFGDYGSDVSATAGTFVGQINDPITIDNS